MNDVSQVDAVLGRRLKEMREDRRMTQAEVVKRLVGQGVSYMNTSTLSRIELSTRPVRLGEAIAFASIYDVPMSALVDTGQNFSAIDLVARRHLEARRKFVQYRDSIVDIVREQHKLKDLVALADEILGGDDVEDGLRDDLEMLRRNVVDLAEKDLLVEAAEMIEQTRARLRVGEDSPAGRFLNSKDRRGKR